MFGIIVFIVFTVIQFYRKEIRWYMEKEKFTHIISLLPYTVCTPV